MRRKRMASRQYSVAISGGHLLRRSTWHDRGILTTLWCINRPIPDPIMNVRTPGTRRIAGALTAAGVVLLGACSSSASDGTSLADTAGRPEATVAQDISTASAISEDTAADPVRQPEQSARDADQRFLRELLDRHERLSVIVHERMMMRHDDHAMQPGVAMEPARNTGAFDSAFDRERRAIADALRTLYRDEHPPLQLPRAQRRIDSLARNAPVSGDSAYRRQLIDGLQHQQLLIERAMPVLQRPEARALARKLAVSLRERASLLQSASAH